MSSKNPKFHFSNPIKTRLLPSSPLWLFPAQYRANKYIACLIEVLAGPNEASGAELTGNSSNNA